MAERRKLAIGDVQWIARSKHDPAVEIVLDAVVERKKMHDLGSSIRDERYREQRVRLRRTGMSRVVYLVEGVLDKYCGLTEDTLRSCVAHLSGVFGFWVHQTLSAQGSAAFLATLTASLHAWHVQSGIPNPLRNASHPADSSVPLRQSVCPLLGGLSADPTEISMISSPIIPYPGEFYADFTERLQKGKGRPISFLPFCCSAAVSQGNIGLYSVSSVSPVSSGVSTG